MKAYILMLLSIKVTFLKKKCLVLCSASTKINIVLKLLILNTEINFWGLCFSRIYECCGYMTPNEVEDE